MSLEQFGTGLSSLYQVLLDERLNAVYTFCLAHGFELGTIEISSGERLPELIEVTVSIKFTGNEKTLPLDKRWSHVKNTLLDKIITIVPALMFQREYQGKDGKPHTAYHPAIFGFTPETPYNCKVIFQYWRKIK